VDELGGRVGGVILNAFFQPHSVAVIGATLRVGSVGRSIVENLRAFPGDVFWVNPKHAELEGRVVYPSVAAIGQRVDLAVIVTPAGSVPGLIRECGEAGIGGVIVISAGFRETGAVGAALEAEILATARELGVRIVGPNCLGLMVPALGLNATFASQMAMPGRVAFLSQSGALCTAILDWSLRDGVGFRAFVSVGSMMDVGWADLIRHLGEDEQTDSIVIYMESVGDGQAFLEAAREVALRKPIVVIKVGRTEGAAHAAASHTGALTGSDAVLDAALRQSGVLRVSTIEELFDVSEILAKQPLPRGRRLGIVTNAGGPGALAVDALVGAGGELAALRAETLSGLSAVLPGHWSHGNPVDVLGDADTGRYVEAIKIVSTDAGVDGLLVVLTPQSMTKPTEVAEGLVAGVKGISKPVLASWMGGRGVTDGRRRLNEAGIPTCDYPDQAARAFVLMWERSRRLEWLVETQRAFLEPPLQAIRAGDASMILAAARSAGRTLLSESEAKAVLSAWGIPVVTTQVATDEEAAVRLAVEMGFPVVVKLHSLTLTHKTDVGGVQLNLSSEEAVRAAWQKIRGAVSPDDFQGVSVQRMIIAKGYELILGSKTDAQFGPVLLFGSGGTLVEVFQDRALALPPISREMAPRWMAETKIYQALLGIRGRGPVDLDGLTDCLVRFSAMVSAQKEILEVDINPLIASPEGIVALDARIVLRS